MRNLPTASARLALSLAALALLVATPLARAADDGPALLLHQPPAEAPAAQPLVVDARIDRAWQETLELRYRPAGETMWRAVAFERAADEVWRAIVPGDAVHPPGLEYFVVGRDQAGGERAHFASAAHPHLVLVEDDAKAVEREAELAKYAHRRARARVAVEWVDFGTRTIMGRELVDRYLRVDADFTYRLLRFPLHSLRFGYTYLLGRTPATARDGGAFDPCDPAYEDPDAPGSCSGEAGTKAAGWFELRLRVSPLVGLDLRGVLAATKTDFSLGARAELRIGSELGSHVALGGEVIGEAGATGFLRLGWDTVPYFPMAATIELTDLPSEHRATAVRLIYDVAHPLESGLRLGLRAGYQARDSEVGGLSLGANVSLDF